MYKKQNELQWSKLATLNEKPDLQSNFTHPVPDYQLPFDIFFAMTNLNALLKTIVLLSILYAQRSDREVQTSEDCI